MKDEAETFVKSIEGDPNWREDPEKVERHESLRIDINHQTRNYQNWERVCANEITSIFGGTHFIGRDPKNPQICKPGEQFYGVNYIPENAAMPWGAPKEVDKPFWEEGIDAVKDYGASWLEGVGIIGKNAVGDRGLVYPFSPEWRRNLPGQLKGSAEFLGSLTGFYDYRTGDGGLLDWSAGSAANAWKELGNAFVPLSESDRPGYVVTQAVLNIGTLGIGVAPKLGKLGRLGSDVPSHGGNGPDLNQHIPDPSNPSNPANPAHAPSVKELQLQLDKLEQQTFDGYSPTNAMDVVTDIPMHEHAMTDGPDVQANADGPHDPPSAASDSSTSHPESSSVSGENQEQPDNEGSTGYPNEPIRGDGGPPNREDVKVADVLSITKANGKDKIDLTDFGYTDSNGYWYDENGSAYIETPETKQAAEKYAKIREMENDTQKISEDTGYPLDLINRVKDHLFYKDHEVAFSPDDIRTARFTPMENLGDMWLKFATGSPTTPEEQLAFRRSLAHEGVESKLMEKGIPYLSTHPDAFEGGDSQPTPDHYGAHNLAPDPYTFPPFAHYEGMGRAGFDFQINDDLSNLDDLVVEIEKEFLHE